MQPRVTVALATVWFTVAGLVGGTVTLRLSNDQYSPASPHRYAELQRNQTRDWRAHGSAEDQPLDLWIGSRRSISAEELRALRHNVKFVEQNFSLEKPLKDIVSSKRVYSLSSWQRRLPNIATTEFAADKVDYGYEMPETLSREAMVPRSDLLDDPFVADDTFQDQGPGSMEIYKLDLSKEKVLFTATTPPMNLPSRNKSKTPKKTDHLNLKTKTTEIKSTTIDPKVHHRQSNFFEEQRTESPSVNRDDFDAFDFGIVPELQVGCEGLEASPSSHKTKRSIDTPDKEEGVAPASLLLDVMPISLDLDYNLSYDEENYEEMDELLKLKKLETTTKKNKPNRGDMDASHLNSDHLDESRRSEKLPIRGDLGKSIPRNSRGLKIDQEKSQKSKDLEIKKGTKAKRALILSNDAIRNRRLLWLTEANIKGFADGKGERKRAKRSAKWGFGENEGVVSSDELQTVNERRRQHEMRYHQDVSRRRDQHREINPDIDSIRREYEDLLQKRKEEEEERLRRMQQGGRKTLARWEEEERRRDEMRKTQHDKYHNRMDHTSTPRIDDEEMRRRQMEEKQRQEIERDRTQEMARRKEEEQRRLREEEERRRQLQEEIETKKKPHDNKWKEENARKSKSKTPASDEERRQKLHNEEIRRREEERQRQLQREEARRQEQYRSQQEAQKRKEEEERRRQEDRARNLSKDDRIRLEERRREWSEKKKQQEEDEIRRQQPPSNLMRVGHQIGHPNDIGQRDRDQERRMREQDERQREQKLREYIARNQPINVSHANRKSEETKRGNRPEENRAPRMNASRDDEEYRAKEQRRRQEEERKLQDYIRRNQPMKVPSKSDQSSIKDRNWFEERRLIEEARHRDPDRYPDSGARRHHGPSAPTYNIDRRGGSPEEVRQRQQETERRLKQERQQRYEAEERRKELARRQREEGERRLREERMRQEAVRREEEARKAQSRRYEEDRKRLEAMKLQAERRRQETLKEHSRSEAGRTRQPEATRPTYYQGPHLLVEHRRRQDSQPIPSNLVRNEEARRIAAERERQRLEAERRRQDDSRMREQKPKETDQRRRQELVRLNSLPVSARIIVVRPNSLSPVSPVVISRTGFDNEIDFTGINPHREGIEASKFPAPPTSRPPPESPKPCIWAIVQCCSPNNNRLVKCFESMGCPGVNWDPSPCRASVVNAARTEVMKFYEKASNQ